MKTILKKLFVVLAIATATLTVPSLAINPTYAAGEATANNDLGSCRTFLGMTSWDCGINPNIQSESELTSSAVLIASNILTDLTVLATYLVIGFVIYGGYLYIFSYGDAARVQAGKKTLTRAFIGLAIVVFATVILNTIRIVFLGQSGSFANNCAASADACVDQVSFVTNIINWFIGTAGAIALVFVFIGGIGYITSAGDPGKLQKAKSTIIYSLVGLIIVALSLGITAFASNIIRGNQAESAYINNLVAKELTYEN